MKERLLLFMNRENISATTLAEEIGVQRSSVSHILSGRNNPSYDFIYKMTTRYPNLNIEWLLTGSGEIYKSETEINSNHDLSFGEDSENSENDNNKKNHDAEVTNVNKIEKIVYFYKNGTFKEYNPSE